MAREVWALAEAFITIWREVAGVKNGPVLLEAAYIRDVSLSERPNVVRKQQPDVSQDSIVVNGVQTVFQMSKDYLSKTVTEAITDFQLQYWIEVSMVNPLYDGITQVDDLHILHTCTPTAKGFAGEDNDIFEEEVAYNVAEVT